MGICGSKNTEVTEPAVSRQRDGGRENVLSGQGRPSNNPTSSDSNDTRVEKGDHACPADVSATNSSERSKKDEEVKVLLLGAGESGKSTIIQQLKILHQNGFTQDELLEYRSVVFRNLLDIGKELIEARTKFEVSLESDSGITEKDLQGFYRFDANDDRKTDGENATVKNSENGAISQPVEKEPSESESDQSLSNLVQFPAELADTLRKLWNLPSTQQLIEGKHRSEFYLMDSASYYLENLTRIARSDYIPNEQDILRSRQKTSGLFDSVFDLGSNLKLHIYDVGGQRSERKKWIHCFDNVTLIIFCVSLSEYDQLLLEDQDQNRFQESLVLYDNVVNSRWFARTSVVLFLNKIDLFAEKIQKVPLENYFPDYTGGQDINKAAKYILWRFVRLNRANLNIYPHVTQATDTSNIKLVFAAIKETLLENTLKDSGVL
ncbi:hypothetical protein HG536_0F00790 [Torulaspora globosa]|uniref:Guanine nucleotide-binding protein alpha-2 subunit n=1 Tax=Torulaspora globosa TaxID=48254 RepID=A0A7G3ZJR8_9SACH|nr:uncharacterized protein HG536_0F00790 [Torulaspora globosa]QLL33754.1 hypothetical protein HG536_0F00790 [Torulaspora globosa]